MRIFLVRHGTPYTADEDPERKLNNEGLEQCRNVGIVLESFGFSFDLIISSPKPRAVQTAKIIGGLTGYPEDKLKITPALEPNAPPDEVVDFLKNQTGVNSVLIAGHFPSLPNIAATLLDRNEKVSISFDTASICRIDVQNFGMYNADLRWLLKAEHTTLMAKSRLA